MLGIIETKMLRIGLGEREQIDVISTDILGIVDELKANAESPASPPPSPTIPALPPEDVSYSLVRFPQSPPMQTFAILS